MTLWEHCLWLEIERCKRLQLPMVEFSEVDRSVIELSKAIEYTPPSSPPPSEPEGR